MPTNRRHFLRTSIAGASALTVPSWRFVNGTSSQSQESLVTGVFTEDQFIGWFDEVHPASECRVAREAGNRIFGVNFYESYRGKLYYASELHPELRLFKNRDLLQEYSHAARDNGLELWLWSIERGAPQDTELASRFKEGTVVDSEGRPIPPWGDPNILAFCPNSPWREFIARIYGEVVSSYKVGGFLVSDQPGKFENGCYCKYCRERFLREEGAEPPTQADWKHENSLWWRFVRARTRWWTDYLNHISHAVKQVSPRTRTAIAFSPGSLPRNHLWHGIDEWQVMSAPALDAYATDLWRTNQHPAWHTFCVDLARALARRTPGKDAFPLIGGQATNASDTRSALCCGAVSGANPMLTSPLHAILDYPENLGSIGRTFPHLAEVPGLVDSEPIPYAAIWVSQWAWDRVDHLTESPYYGVYGAHHALTWSSLPFRLLTVGYDEVPDISLYQLVVLASVGRLESRQLDALRRFVARGGGLLVAGLPRADSEESLRQLLGAQQQIEEKPAYRLRIEADAAHALTLRQDLVERSMLRWPYRPFLRPGLRAMGGARACASYLSLADERTATAGIWLEQPGAGRVVFFSDPLFEVIPAWMDRQRGNKDHSQGCGEGYRYGRLLGAFAAWAGGQDPPLTLQARDNVYANGRISRDGKLILILNCNYDRPARVRLWVRVPAEGKQPEVISRIPKFSYHFSDTGGQRRGVSIDGLIPPGGLEWVVLHART